MAAARPGFLRFGKKERKNRERNHKVFLFCCLN